MSGWREGEPLAVAEMLESWVETLERDRVMDTTILTVAAGVIRALLAERDALHATRGGLNAIFRPSDWQIDRMAHAAAHADGDCSNCAGGVARRLEAVFPGTDIAARTTDWHERVRDERDCEFGG